MPQIARRKDVSPFRFVEVDLRIGDTEAVIASLEKNYLERSPEMIYLALNPLFGMMQDFKIYSNECGLLREAKLFGNLFARMNN